MNYAKITAILQTRFDNQFAKYKLLEGFDAQVWSDGGEWPIFDSITHLKPVRSPKFSWPQQTVMGRNVDHMVASIVEALSSGNEYSISMLCGSGKSTRLMATLSNRSSFDAVVCIQPSSVAADELCAYVSTTCRDVVVSRSLVADAKCLVYVSASEFLALVHTTEFPPDALIVIDEYHSINPVYKVVQHVLNSMSNKILCMTASNSADLVRREGVHIVAHKDCDSSLDKLITSIKSSNSSTSLVLGCSPAYGLYRASNHYVGVTLSVKTIVDLSTRLDPTIRDNKLIMTYRAAGVTELTQSLGRLARVVGSTGEFHYLLNPPTYTLAANPKLYSRVYDALLSAFGLGIDSNCKSIRATLSCSSSFVVSSSSRSTHAGSVIDSRVPSSSRSKTGSVSILSQTSSVRSPRPDEIMKVKKVASGYMVDYQPKDPIKRALTFRAATWTSKPPLEYFPSSDARQLQLMQNMNSSAFKTPEQGSSTLKPEHFLHPSDMSTVNDILSGKAIPSYSSDEFELVKRAWAVYLQLNPDKTSHASISIEKNISNYYAAYQRATNVFIESSTSRSNKGHH